MDPTIHHGLRQVYGDLLIAENTLFLRDTSMVQVIHGMEQAHMWSSVLLTQFYYETRTNLKAKFEEKNACCFAQVAPVNKSYIQTLLNSIFPIPPL